MLSKDFYFLENSYYPHIFAVLRQNTSIFFKTKSNEIVQGELQRFLKLVLMNLRNYYCLECSSFLQIAVSLSVVKDVNTSKTFPEIIVERKSYFSLLKMITIQKCLHDCHFHLA